MTVSAPYPPAFRARHATSSAKHLRELSELNLELLDLRVGDRRDRDADRGRRSQADKDDEIPAPPPGPAVCQTGDVWVLGPHRIICSNSLEESAYRVLMGNERAVAVFTDPPHNVPIDNQASGLGAG